MNLGIVILALVTVVFLVAIIQSMKNPPKMIDLDELPQIVSSEVNFYFPEFEYESIRFLPLKKEYDIKGKYFEDLAKVEVELNKEGAIKELEFELKGYYRKRRGAALKDVGEIPKPVLEVAFAFLGADNEPPEFMRGNHIKFSDEAGFSFKLRKGKILYKFQILENEKLVEFEVDKVG